MSADDPAGTHIMDPGGGGLDWERVAQLRVRRDSGEDRGSGYRVTNAAVLTAAHVVAEAQSVEVVFNPDQPNQWSVPATVKLCEPAGDVAVLIINPPEEHRSAKPVRFGQVGMRAAVLRCRAVGFPLFKLRTGKTAVDLSAQAAPYRDSHQADGHISSLSGSREGTLEITVPPPSEDPDPKRSPWEGMSGAAVWCADRIVGVVSRHHRNEGPNRLAAARINRWYDQLDTNRLDELCQLVGLPAAAAQLVDVIQAEPTQLLAAAYTAFIEGIAPLSLRDREQELAELTAFCAGDEFYAWWQAGPWAGKTALTSWFALHPPLGVTVVAFFVIRRFGRADSNAFTEDLIEQLTVLTGQPDIHPASLAARDGRRRSLLQEGAAQAVAEGRRLLLLVDGLDEDEGVPPAGRSSIAALLPRRPVEGLQVLVTSRPHPGLPHDIVPDHPLCEFRKDHPLPHFRPRELEPSEIGAELETLAKKELLDHLHGTDQLAKEIIAGIAAARFGLTVGELGELIDARYVDLQARLSSILGRSLKSWTSTETQLSSWNEIIYSVRDVTV